MLVYGCLRPLLLTYLLLFPNRGAIFTKTSGRWTEMELQLALDCLGFDQARRILDEVSGVIDIVEIGTPFIIREGIEAVRKTRSAFPSLKLCADLKIVDGAKYESQLAFDAGADIVTVLGVSDDATIRAACRKAEEYGKSVMVDMIAIADAARRAREIDLTGAGYICVHTASDVKATSSPPLEDLKKIRREVRNATIAVAGGIDERSAPAIVRENPGVIIVGSWITGSPSPRDRAIAIRTIMNRGRGNKE
jgi:3-hexulose-6-phosphate synthase